MRYVHLRIENFRGIRLADVPLSSFVCAVGHNNAGKSSLLIAMRLFYSGAKLAREDYYDPDHDIAITVTIEEVTEEIIAQLGEKHASKMQSLVRDGKLQLVRRYTPGGKSTLRCLEWTPREPRFQDENLAQVISGSGKALRDSVLAAFPELASQVTAEVKKQGDFRGLIDGLIKEIPEEDFEPVEKELPTGFDNSVIRILPEPIYIAAVQDVRDELKTTESASMGKIVSVLLNEINKTGEIGKIQDSFSDLNRLMNRQESDEGEIVDERLPVLKTIEGTLGGYLSEQFHGVRVELQIPPPTLKTVFGNARLILNDGVSGDVETKGDGVKRAVLFALFRTYLALKNAQPQEDEGTPTEERYQFLFEEPELHLHPNGQRILYDALAQISAEHQVIVCTHSPYFFSPDDAGTFLRLRKIDNPDNVAMPPIAEILPIHLDGTISVKDAYQIICYETNTAAFFCDRVVLVEGDCDLIYLQHLAKKLNGGWDFLRRNVALVRIGGKGSFGRYRSFFEAFGVDVRIVADLDVLIDQFDKLGADAESQRLHSELIKKIDAIIERDKPSDTVPTRVLKDAVKKNSFRDRYELLREACRRIDAGEKVSPDELPDIKELFAHERDAMRRLVLVNSPEVADAKHELLERLRQQGINVLSIGSIDQYYPDGCTGADKPTRALDACSKVGNRDHAIACSPFINHSVQGEVAELDMVFGNLFDGMAQIVESLSTANSTH